MRQIVLNLLHVHQTHNTGTVLQVETDIVFKSLYIKNIVKTDADELIVTFDKHEAVTCIEFLLLGNGIPVERLIGRSEELIVRDGFHQVVEGIHFIAFYGILLEGGSKYNFRIRSQYLSKFNTREFWHLNIKEEQLYRIRPEFSHCLYSTAESSNKLKERGLLNITFK